MIVKLLNEQHLEILRLKESCKGSSESKLFKTPHCWKSHVNAQLLYFTVLPAKRDSDFMFCLQSYNELRIDNSLAG